MKICIEFAISLLRYFILVDKRFGKAALSRCDCQNVNATFSAFFAFLNDFSILFLLSGFEIIFYLNTWYSFDGPCCNSLDAN